MQPLEISGKVALAALLLVVLPETARGQSKSLEGQIDDLAFLHYYGTGIYDVGAQRVYVIRVPPSLLVRDVKPDQMGIMVRSAIVLAIENFSDLVEPDFNQRELFSFSGGVELLIPIGRLRLLRPYADVGYGVDNELDHHSLITGMGVRAEILRLFGPWRTAVEPKIALATSRRLPGFDAGGEYSEFGIKLTARHPLPFTLWEGTPDAGIYTAGSYLFDSLTIVDDEGDLAPIRGLVEVGVIFGYQTPRPKWWGLFEPPSVSVGYQFGDDFSGIKIGVGGDWLTPIPGNR